MLSKTVGLTCFASFYGIAHAAVLLVRTSHIHAHVKTRTNGVFCTHERTQTVALKTLLRLEVEQPLEIEDHTVSCLGQECRDGLRLWSRSYSRTFCLKKALRLPPLLSKLFHPTKVDTVMRSNTFSLSACHVPVRTISPSFCVKKRESSMRCLFCGVQGRSAFFLSL